MPLFFRKALAGIDIASVLLFTIPKTLFTIFFTRLVTLLYSYVQFRDQVQREYVQLFTGLLHQFHCHVVPIDNGDVMAYVVERFIEKTDRWSAISYLVSNAPWGDLVLSILLTSTTIVVGANLAIFLYGTGGKIVEILPLAIGKMLESPINSLGWGGKAKIDELQASKPWYRRVVDYSPTESDKAQQETAYTAEMASPIKDTSQQGESSTQALPIKDGSMAEHEGGVATSGLLGNLLDFISLRKFKLFQPNQPVSSRKSSSLPGGTPSPGNSPFEGGVAVARQKAGLMSNRPAVEPTPSSMGLQEDTPPSPGLDADSGHQGLWRQSTADYQDLGKVKQAMAAAEVKGAAVKAVKVAQAFFSDRRKDAPAASDTPPDSGPSQAQPPMPEPSTSAWGFDG